MESDKPRRIVSFNFDMHRRSGIPVETFRKFFAQLPDDAIVRSTVFYHERQAQGIWVESIIFKDITQGGLVPISHVKETLDTASGKITDVKVTWEGKS